MKSSGVCWRTSAPLRRCRAKIRACDCRSQRRLCGEPWHSGPGRSSVSVVGTSAALKGVPPQALSASGPVFAGQMGQQGIEANVAALAKRLEQNPGDADGWAMLGRSYVSLEKYGDASNAYAKAAELKKNDADILTEYAFALAMANGRKLEGRPAELIKQALSIAPENPKVLATGRHR